MAHFRGSVKGNRKTEASRLGTVKSGLVVEAASWQGAVRVELTHDSRDDSDRVYVALIPWHGRGRSLLLYNDRVSGDQSAFSEAEKLCLNFLTAAEKPYEENGKMVCKIDKELYKRLRIFLLGRSAGE